MNRVLVILMISLAGFSGFGVGSTKAVGRSHSCDETDCYELAGHDACCEEDVTDLCSSSDGPCRCSCTSAPVRLPLPDAPFPHPERETRTSIFNGSFLIVELVEPGTDFHCENVRSSGLLAGLTNNEVQALFGIWRT